MPLVPRSAVRVRILSVGKASPAMARAALSTAAATRVDRALVVAPDGTDASFDDPRVEVLRAAHPDPDGRSVIAAKRALDLMRASDYTVALVSGGASALVCLPQGLSLARYVRLVRALLLGGATVREINVVRRHLCAVKGGGLARVAPGALMTLIASDVVGGGPHDVGSGPTVADPTTRADAVRVLRRFAPHVARPRMHESLKPSETTSRRSRVRVVASPEDLAQAVARELRACGFTVRIAPSSVASPADLVRDYLTRARTLSPGEAVVRAAEPSVRVEAVRPGRGGRSTHLATLLATALPDGVAFLAGASDGVDGTSGTAGAIVDASLARRASPSAIERAVAQFDTAPLLESASMALHIGATGANYADIHVLARALS
jgi:hydroxypyruvate reductase